jgi:hypothetical protein
VWAEDHKTSTGQQQQQKATTHETRQTKTGEQKKVPFAREREEEESTGRVLTPLPHPPIFFLAKFSELAKCLFEMAKNICVIFCFFVFFSHQISTDIVRFLYSVVVW